MKERASSAIAGLKLTEDVMYKTYKCMRCNVEWTERAGPSDCPSCGHRYLEVIGGFVPNDNDNKKEESKDEGKPFAERVVTKTRIFPSQRHERPDRVSSHGGFEDDCPFDPNTGR